MVIHSPDTSIGIQAQVKQKLDFHAVDSSYQTRLEDGNSTHKNHGDYGDSCIDPQIGAPRSSSQILEELRATIKDRAEMMPSESEQAHIGIAKDRMFPHCLKQYDFGCKLESCKICSGHAKNLQKKEAFVGLKNVQKEEEGFQDFVKYELNEEGIVKSSIRKTGIQEEAQLELLKKLNKSKIAPKDDLVFVEQSFNWLMEKLVSPSEQILGCEVNIPETVLFEDGKPKMFLKNEKDGCVSQFLKNKSKLSTVQKYFSQAYQDRKKAATNEAAAVQEKQGKIVKDGSQRNTLGIVSEGGDSKHQMSRQTPSVSPKKTDQFADYTENGTEDQTGLNESDFGKAVTIAGKTIRGQPTSTE